VTKLNSQAPADAAHFGDRLAAAVKHAGNAVVVGLDPQYALLPEPLSRGASANWRQQAECFAAFCRGVVDVVAPLVPAVKPQAAFFEQLGPAGTQALAEVIAYARGKGLLVIIDGKRNDIGSTAAAYAAGYLGSASPWGGDALTVSPYLGDDSLTPFVDTCARRGAGIFVLVKTSNPGGGTFQDRMADGRPLYRHVAEHIEHLARQSIGTCGYGLVGAVVGATYPQQAVELRGLMPHAWFLVPGYGSQGATARDVAGTFDAQGLGAIVNSSRAIIFAHARREYAARFGPAHWQEAVEAATRAMIAELAADTPCGKLTGN
jgi:orotidine-5'-phosphate decarboxylase